MEHCAFASEGPDGIEFCSSERRSAGRGGTARAPRRDRLQRRRRELSRGARRALRRARDPPRHLPPGRRRGVHGRGLRQAHRQARGVAGDPRPGRLQRLDRHPHGVPGFDPDGRAGRPGRPPPDRPRGLSGGRFPPHVRPARQMGGADRPRRTRPRTHEPGVPGRDLRPARPGGAGLARGHAARPGRSRGRWPLPRRCAPIRVRPTSPSCAGCWPLPSARSCWSAAAAGATPPAPTSPVSPRPTTCRSAARSAARTSSTTVWAYSPAISAPAPARRWSPGSSNPTCCWRSAPASARSPRNPIRCSASPTPARR